MNSRTVHRCKICISFAPFPAGNFPAMNPGPSDCYHTIFVNGIVWLLVPKNRPFSLYPTQPIPMNMPQSSVPSSCEMAHLVLFALLSFTSRTSPTTHDAWRWSGVCPNWRYASYLVWLFPTERSPATVEMHSPKMSQCFSVRRTLFFLLIFQTPS